MKKRIRTDSPICVQPVGLQQHLLYADKKQLVRYIVECNADLLFNEICGLSNMKWERVSAIEEALQKNTQVDQVAVTQTLNILKDFYQFIDACLSYRTNPSLMSSTIISLHYSRGWNKALTYICHEKGYEQWTPLHIIAACVEEGSVKSWNDEDQTTSTLLLYILSKLKIKNISQTNQINKAAQIRAKHQDNLCSNTLGFLVLYASDQVISEYCKKLTDQVFSQALTERITLNRFATHPSILHQLIATRSSWLIDQLLFKCGGRKLFNCCKADVDEFRRLLDKNPQCNDVKMNELLCDHLNGVVVFGHWYNYLVQLPHKSGYGDCEKKMQDAVDIFDQFKQATSDQELIELVRRANHPENQPFVQEPLKKMLGREKTYLYLRSDMLALSQVAFVFAYNKFLPVLESFFVEHSLVAPKGYHFKKSIF